MAAFVTLLEDRRMDVQPLVTHVFDIEQAEQAYDIITGKTKKLIWESCSPTPIVRRRHRAKLPRGSPPGPLQSREWPSSEQGASRRSSSSPSRRKAATF